MIAATLCSCELPMGSVRDDLAIQRLLARYSATGRDVAGELMVFFDHTAPARRFALRATALGYLVEIVGCQISLRHIRSR